MTKVTQKKEAAMPSVKRQWPMEESVIFCSKSSKKAMKTKKDDGIAAISRMVFILWGLAGFLLRWLIANVVQGWRKWEGLATVKSENIARSGWGARCFEPYISRSLGLHEVRP